MPFRLAPVTNMTNMRQTAAHISFAVQGRGGPKDQREDRWQSLSSRAYARFAPVPEAREWSSGRGAVKPGPASDVCWCKIAVSLCACCGVACARRSEQRHEPAFAARCVEAGRTPGQAAASNTRTPFRLSAKVLDKVLPACPRSVNRLFKGERHTMLNMATIARTAAPRSAGATRQTRRESRGRVRHDNPGSD